MHLCVETSHELWPPNVSDYFGEAQQARLFLFAKFARAAVVLRNVSVSALREG